jgi:hypothetical protein
MCDILGSQEYLSCYNILSNQNEALHSVFFVKFEGVSVFIADQSGEIDERLALRSQSATRASAASHEVKC